MFLYIYIIDTVYRILLDYVNILRISLIYIIDSCIYTVYINTHIFYKIGSDTNGKRKELLHKHNCKLRKTQDSLAVDKRLVLLNKTKENL